MKTIINQLNKGVINNKLLITTYYAEFVGGTPSLEQLKPRGVQLRWKKENIQE